MLLTPSAKSFYFIRNLGHIEDAYYHFFFVVDLSIWSCLLLSFLLQLIIACRKGGTSIEDLAEKFPDMIIKVTFLSIHPRFSCFVLLLLLPTNKLSLHLYFPGSNWCFQRNQWCRCCKGCWWFGSKSSWQKRFNWTSEKVV